jgi:hypothetical protein
VPDHRPAPELAATLELPPLERYSYLVHRVAGSAEAWGLRSADGWVLVSDDAGDGGDAFCLWPHPAFAQACIDGREDCFPEPIALQELVEELLPALAEDAIRLAAFPAPTGEVALVDARDFGHHLEAELRQCRERDA